MPKETRNREAYERYQVVLIRGLSLTIYARRRARFSNFVGPFFRAVATFP